jgi:hypothetical protein
LPDVPDAERRVDRPPCLPTSEQLSLENERLNQEIRRLLPIETRLVELESQLSREKQKFQALEKEQETLLLCLAEQEIELSSLRKLSNHSDRSGLPRTVSGRMPSFASSLAE